MSLHWQFFSIYNVFTTLSSIAGTRTVEIPPAPSTQLSTASPSTTLQPQVSIPALTHTHTRQRQVIGLDAEFFSVDDGKKNSRGNPSRISRVGLLALVTRNDDRSCKTLFRNVVKPRLTNDETLYINTRFTGVTWRDYRNGIPYDEAIAEVKSLLKDTIVVGHDIRSDERALCFSLDSVAHRVIDTATNPTQTILFPPRRARLSPSYVGL